MRTSGEPSCWAWGPSFIVLYMVTPKVLPVFTVCVGIPYGLTGRATIVCKKSTPGDQGEKLWPGESNIKCPVPPSADGENLSRGATDNGSKEHRSLHHNQDQRAYLLTINHDVGKRPIGLSYQNKCSYFSASPCKAKTSPSRRDRQMDSARNAVSQSPRWWRDVEHLRPWKALRDSFQNKLIVEKSSVSQWQEI